MISMVPILEICRVIISLSGIESNLTRLHLRIYLLRRQVSGMRSKEAETRAEMASQDDKWQQVVELMQQEIKQLRQAQEQRD